MITRTLVALLALAGLGSAQQVFKLEIDYMVGSDHTHKPQPAEIAALVNMFLCHNILLQVVVSDEVPHVNVMRTDDPGEDDFWTSNSSTYTTFDDIKSQYFSAPFPGTGWHYCIFGHSYDNGKGTGSSGLAELEGNDLVVTLGSFFENEGTPFRRASTLAHEFGHNLGLEHWGKNSTSFGKYPPNYASVMSYEYQLQGVRSQMECLGLVAEDHLFKDLDYSSGRLPALNEFALIETDGVGIHDIDWDCDGVLDPSAVMQDIDSERPWCGAGSPSPGLLRDYNDWANLNDFARLPRVVDGTAALETVHCITRAEADAVRDASASAAGLIDPSPCTGVSPTLVLESCGSAQMFWVDPAAGGLPVGTGELPFADIAVAIAVAPSGSVLYLQDGTYTNGNTSLVISKALVLTGPGGAVIDP